MDVKNSPFSLYDFLGYFFPGAFAIFAFSHALAAFGLGVNLLTVNQLSQWSNLLPFTISAYVVGHALALTSSFTIERYYIWSFDYPSKTLLRYESRPFRSDSLVENLPRYLVALLLLPISGPISVVCWCTRKKLGMIHQLDALLARLVRRKITALIVDVGQIARPNDYVGPKECDYFRLVYHFTVERCPSHLPKMQNYVALFGFNRAMSLLFVAVFWLSILTTAFGSMPLRGAFIWMITSFLLSNLFFFGFAKFYRRFSLESLMAFGASYQIPSTLEGVKLPARPRKTKPVGRDLKSQISPVGKLMFRARRKLLRNPH